MNEPRVMLERERSLNQERDAEERTTRRCALMHHAESCVKSSRVMRHMYRWSGPSAPNR